MQAVVIPADLTQLVRVVDYPSAAAAAALKISQTIGVDEIGGAAATTPLGECVIWVDGEALRGNGAGGDGRHDHNPDATSLFRAFGYAVPDLVGTVVVTGGPSERVGHLLDVPPRLRDLLTEHLNPVRGADHQGRRRAFLDADRASRITTAAPFDPLRHGRRDRGPQPRP